MDIYGNGEECEKGTCNMIMIRKVIGTLMDSE